MNIITNNLHTIGKMLWVNKWPVTGIAASVGLASKALPLAVQETAANTFNTIFSKAAEMPISGLWSLFSHTAQPMMKEGIKQSVKGGGEALLDIAKGGVEAVSELAIDTLKSPDRALAPLFNNHEGASNTKGLVDWVASRTASLFYAAEVPSQNTNPSEEGSRLNVSENFNLQGIAKVAEPYAYGILAAGIFGVACYSIYNKHFKKIEVNPKDAPKVDVPPQDQDAPKVDAPPPDQAAK